MADQVEPLHDALPRHLAPEHLADGPGGNVPASRSRALQGWLRARIGRDQAASTRASVVQVASVIPAAMAGRATQGFVGFHEVVVRQVERDGCLEVVQLLAERQRQAGQPLAMGPAG